VYVLCSLCLGITLTESPHTDCGWIFAQHFCNRLGPAYIGLKNVLDEANPDHAEVLNNIKRRFREETFTREGIADVIQAHPELVSFRCARWYGINDTKRHLQIRMLYVNFAMSHYPSAEEGSTIM
jgi:glutamate dehydrogenase